MSGEQSPAVGPATDGGPQSGRGSLVYRFEVGRTYRYSVVAGLEGSVTVDGATEDYVERESVDVELTPTDVEPDGSILVRLEQQAGNFEVNRQTGTISPTSSIVTIAPDGRVVKVRNPWGAALLQEGLFGYPGVNQLLPVLPEDPSEAGRRTSWSTSFRQELPDVDEVLRYVVEGRLVRPGDPGVPPGDYDVKVHLTVPLDLRADARPGLSALNIELAGSSPTVAMSGSADVTMFAQFDEATGQLVSMVSEGSLNMTVRYIDFPRSLNTPRELGFTGTIQFDLVAIR
jgi:hypothetical protein